MVEIINEKIATVALLKRLAQKRPRNLTIISIVVLVLFMFATLALGNLAASITRQKTAEQYKWDTEQISNRIQRTLNNYSSVLYSGRAFMTNSQNVEPEEWSGYFLSQDIFNRYKGMSSIAYIPLTPASQRASFEAKMKRYYGQAFVIRPDGDRAFYAAASLNVSTTGINPTGYDVYSDSERAAIYEAAKSTGQPTASAELSLATGPQGMFVVLPVNQGGTTTGFINVSLHSDDFFQAMVDPELLGDFSLKVTDVTDPTNPKSLYAAGAKQDDISTLTRKDNITFGGRTWEIQYRAPSTYNQSTIATALPFMIVGMSALFVTVLALCFRLFRMHIPSKREQDHFSKRVVTKTTKETTTTTE